MSNQPPPSGILDQKHAETLARLFNIAYNAAVLYGGSHQTTIDSSVPLYKYLYGFVQDGTTLSLIVQRDSVYIENFCIDKIINVRRLVLHFKKAGINSISFDNDLTEESIRILLAILGDMQQYSTLDAMTGGLSLLGARGIRLNYVVYQKMTADQQVVDRDAVVAQGQATQGTSAAQKVLEGLSEVVLAEQIIGGTGQSTALPVGETSKSGIGLSELLSRLRSIKTQVKQSSGSPEKPISVQEMVESVIRLKKEVNDNLGVIRKTHELNEMETGVADELETMSREVMLGLLREEYKGGGVSIRRLAQIARRMLPDIKELKKMLPKLKESLLADGMSQADYLQFVTDILKDIEADGISSVFESAVGDIGVSMEELLDSIRADPTDAARLIVLASEIRKSSKNDDAQVSKLLTDYVERVSSSLSLESDAVSHKEGIHLLKTTIGKIEADLVDKLKNQGVPSSVLQRSTELLQSRFEETIAAAKQEWVSRFVGSLGSLGENEILLVFKDLHSSVSDQVMLREQFEKALVAKGYNAERIAGFFEKAARERKDPLRGILNVNATLYFLEREIKRHQRYNTPFSTMIVTVVGVKPENGIFVPANADHIKSLLPRVLVHLRSVLRDLDLVGSLGLVSGDVPFVVLPMTETAGAEKVVDRLNRELNAMTFDCDGAKTEAKFVISKFAFDKATMTGYRSFLELALANHRKLEQKDAVRL